jgi:myo-inositol-1(or 4)-monophosphatase
VTATHPLLALAVDAAQAAGDVLLRERERVVESGAYRTKSSDTDPVTAADEAAQRATAGLIGRARPNDALVGEENLRRAGSSGHRWIIDPLDGTVNYMYGRDDWAVSIAAEDPHGIVAGVVHAPVPGRTFLAVRGEGAWLGQRRLSVRTGTNLATALVGTGFSYTAEGRAKQAAALNRLLPRVADLRRSGSAALDLASVAAGALDAFYEDDLNEWDWAAGALLAREAGATVRSLPGPGHRSGVLAAAPDLFPLLAELVTP